MTVSLKALRGRPISARDGDIGALVDVYFDDRTWMVRHFVLDTGKPMPRREVLVPPARLSLQESRLRSALSRLEIERGPELDDDRPVYLQHDLADVSYRGDPHLRSAEVLTGYGIEATNGLAGHLKQLYAEADAWRIAWLEVDTGLWFPDRRVRLAPEDVLGFDWLARRLKVRVSREELRTEKGRAEDRAVERVP
jgi:hypothetical protein